LILLLFTTSYPYDYAAEYSFIYPELTHLLEKFEKIILVPRVCKGEKLPLPPGVEVEEQHAAFLSQNSNPVNTVKRILRSEIFYREIQKNKALLLQPVKLLKLFMFSSNVEMTRQWTIAQIENGRFPENNIVLYSYWFNHIATGLALVRQEFPDIKAVSRAHGYDIYEENFPPHYWPYRPETLQLLDKLFLASEASKQYFLRRYPEFASRYEMFHLGINDPAFLAKSSTDNIFRIVSCSNILFVKRLDLLLDGLVVMARTRPNQKFEWTHFGDGKDRASLEKRMRRSFPPNIQGRFMGRVPNREIMQFYQNNPCDVLINVSEIEGGAPVSIQEAISCGIPVVATAIGGNPEVVSEGNGILLPPDPTPGEIAEALLKIWDDPQTAAEMRKESRRIWQASYNAEVNFHAFAECLKLVADS